MQFISLSNFVERHHILWPEIWGKTFTDCFEKCSDGYVFSNPAIHRIGNVSNILCLRCKELSPATELGSKETFLKTWNSLKLLVFSESATIVALVVPGVNTPPYSQRFRSPIYTKALDHRLTYIIFEFIAVAFLLSFTDLLLYKRLNSDLQSS